MADADAGAPGPVPRHVAIIMDGNGRWAQQRGLQRHEGHRAGVESVRRCVEASLVAGVEVLTLFAFSSENWQRPKKEVSLLMGLFFAALQREVKRLKANNVRLRIIGDRSAFSDKLRDKIAEAEAETADGAGLLLQVAANYGGRWDITTAARALVRGALAGKLAPEAVDETTLASYLSTAGLPDPDLFIRTGGERRISNFLLWQSAYTELYFSDLLWPDFQTAAYEEALRWFAGRQRRFGRTGEQVRPARAD